MEEKDKKTGENKENTSVALELFGWAQSLIWALLVLVFISSFFVRISGVNGDSMYPTLHHGDRMLLRLNYNEPKHGDIVVVMAPGFDENEPLVKRIIAVAGDEIDIDDEGNVWVNGEHLYEPYVNEQYFNGGSMSYPYYVPEGHVFVMGDNRNYSADSRAEYIGALKVEDIIGRVFFRMWPMNSFGGL
ncbi:MAG: signal peptidase I [Clostridia bacterium]|nr:signal peptidase I [Clostridia bacterium]